MKHLLLAMLCAALFPFGGCAKNPAPADRATLATQAAQPDAAAREAGPQKVLTAEDLKIQTKHSPIRKYNGLSLQEAREAENAKKSGMRNDGRTTRSGRYSANNPI